MFRSVCRWRDLEDMSRDFKAGYCQRFLHEFHGQQDAATPPCLAPAAEKHEQCKVQVVRDKAEAKAAHSRTMFAKRTANKSEKVQPRNLTTEPPKMRDSGSQENTAAAPLPRDLSPATEPPPQRVQPETVAPKPVPPTRESKQPTRATEPLPQRVQPETAAPKPVPPTRETKPPPPRATEPLPQRVQPETAAPTVPPTRETKPPPRATESPASVAEPYALPARDHEKHLRNALTAHVIPRSRGAVPGAPPEPIRAATTRNRPRAGRTAARAEAARQRAQGPGCIHCIYGKSGHQHDCSGSARRVVDADPPETFVSRLAATRSMLDSSAACRTLCALCTPP
jgi:hypothetical protein